METARLQGFKAHTIKWPKKLATGFALLGNTMSVNVLQRLLISILRVFGHQEIQDPWENGQAIAAPPGGQRKRHGDSTTREMNH